LSNSAVIETGRTARRREKRMDGSIVERLGSPIEDVVTSATPRNAGFCTQVTSRRHTASTLPDEGGIRSGDQGKPGEQGG
jgi:hypothetical protein